MKFTTLFLIICLLVIPLAVSAIDNTTNITLNTTINVTPNITQNTTSLPAPEEFYGSATYSDGSPVLSGSEIIAKDQQGNIIGNFIMTFNGSYGDSYASAPRLVVHAKHTDDEITFYIGTTKSSTPSRKFDSGSIKRSDITVDLSAKSLISQTPGPTPTQEPTLNQTPESTSTPIQEPAPSTTPNLKSIVAVTGNVTFPPTPIQTTMTFPITTLPTPKPSTTPTPSPGLDDTTTKFLGVLLVGIGICVVGAIITYYILTKKMKRDDEEEIVL